MKDFNHWDKLHKNEELEEFSKDKVGLLWLKTKSIIRKEFIPEFKLRYLLLYCLFFHW